MIESQTSVITARPENPPATAVADADRDQTRAQLGTIPDIELDQTEQSSAADVCREQTRVLPRLRASIGWADTQLMAMVHPVSTPSIGGAPALSQIAWLAPALVMAMFGFIRLSWPSLWGDELATWGMVTTSWSGMIAVLSSFDAVIAPYYVLMHAWVDVFGASDFALRLPSVIAMTAAVGITARIGTRLAGPRAGFLAGLLLAAVPTTSRYAQEARPYAFVVLAATLATLALLRFVESPRLGRVVAYLASVTLVGLFNVVALLIVVAHGLVVLIHHRSLFWRWQCTVVLGIMPAIPLLLLGSRQTDQVSWIPPATVTRLVSLPTGLFGTGLVAGAMVALALLSVSLRKPAVYYAMGALAPAIALFVVAHMAPLWLPRYLLFTLPAWALLAATPFTRTPVVRGVVAAAAIAAIGIPAQFALRQEDGHTQDSRSAALVIAQNARPGDAIVYGPNSQGESRVGRDLLARYVPADERPTDLLVVLAPRAAGNFMPTECDKPAACLRNPPRVWVLRVGTYQNPLYQLGNEKARLLTNGYEVQSEWYPTGLTVALLVRKAA
jgi:mannosyltransferase